MTHPAFSLELYSLRYALCAMRAFARANLYMDDLNPFQDSYNFMDVPSDSSYNGWPF